MLQLRKIGLFGLILIFWLWGGLWSVSAQEPRPTPTIDPNIGTPGATPDTPTPTATVSTPVPTVTPTPGTSTTEPSSGASGTIRGVVYQDVNGDGKCVNTGVAGEGPLAGVSIEFVSSDEQTVIDLQSGPDGIYGLVAAGYSYWGVTAKPNSDWVVTSEKTLYVPIYEDSLVATDVNFCLQKASDAKVLLPASGDAVAGTFWLTWIIFTGVILFSLGLYLQHRHMNKNNEQAKVINN